jgi:hypothetical protein
MNKNQLSERRKQICMDCLYNHSMDSWSRCVDMSFAPKKWKFTVTPHVDEKCPYLLEHTVCKDKTGD